MKRTTMADDYLVGQMYAAPDLAEASANDPVVLNLQRADDYLRKTVPVGPAPVPKTLLSMACFMLPLKIEISR